MLSLIICRNLSDIISTTESSFVKEFGADSCKLLFFKENANLPKGRILNPKEAHKFIGKKYDATNVYCGSLDDRESSYIFDKKTKILDCVLVPIKNIDCPGVLALGSKSAETYSDKKDTLCLEFIAEALSSLIERNNY